MLDGAMTADEPRPPMRRARKLSRAEVPPGPVRELRDAFYDLYLRADSPTLDTLAEQIAADDTLTGAPRRDTVNRIISGRDMPAKQGVTNRSPI